MLLTYGALGYMNEFPFNRVKKKVDLIEWASITSPKIEIEDMGTPIAKVWGNTDQQNFGTSETYLEIIIIMMKILMMIKMMMMMIMIMMMRIIIVMIMIFFWQTKKFHYKFSKSYG